MAKKKQGKAPIVAKCRGCGGEFASRYAFKNHVCKGERE